MSTSKIELKTTEEFMADYKPIYQPLYPLFLGNSLQYASEVGKVDFKRIIAKGDLRAKNITPKDTEMHVVSAVSEKKSYKKYFFGTQFQSSEIQSQEGADDVVRQVLDEHQTHQDEIFMLGDGTASNNTLNSGLFWSADSNYLLKSSATISSTSSVLKDFHNSVVSIANESKVNDGRKVVIFYGSTAQEKINALHDNSDLPVKENLQKVLGADFSIVEAPVGLSLSGNGFIVANIDQVKLHYTLLPQLYRRGLNEEKMYYWFNFLMGSMMLEVLANKAVIRQPLAFT